ncbi:MAG: hypothetical protein ABI476_04625 [Oxalobacteraceae bacterium]
MSRISLQVLATAIKKIRAMSMHQKEQLVDELFLKQPNMLNSFLAQKHLGVSFEKMEFLLEILLICFQSMKESGLTWPLITANEEDKQFARYVATIKFGDDLNPSLQYLAMKQYLASHPEQYLLAFVTAETRDWLGRILPEETDRHVMLAAANFVNCIAFVSMPA